MWNKRDKFLEKLLHSHFDSVNWGKQVFLLTFENLISFQKLALFLKQLAVNLYFDTSVHFSHSVMSDSLWPRGLQQARLPCPSPTSGACSNSCPSSWWCHPTSVTPFYSCLQSFPASEFFPMSQFFASGGQIFGSSASASVLLMNLKDLFPLGLTCLISL